MDRRLHYPASAAGWTFLGGALLLLTVGSWVQAQDFKTGMLVTEYLLVLLPVLLLGLVLRVDLRTALRLKPLPLKAMLLIPVIVLLALPITLFLNLLVISALAYLGKAYGVPIPAADSLTELSTLFFIISISAGLCEEFFFRGMMLDAYSSRFGGRRGIAVSAVLFGLYHFNPQNLLGPIFLGLLFGYLVLLTGSIWAGVLAHMTNNGIAVLMMFAANLAQQGAFSAGSSGDLLNSSPKELLVALTVVGTFAIGSAVAVWGLLSVLAEDRKLPGPTDEGAGSAEQTPDGELVSVVIVRRRLSLAELLPLMLPLVFYIAICYYLMAIKS